MAVSPGDLIKVGVRGEEDFGESSVGRQKALRRVPPECLLYCGPFSPFSRPQPTCRPTSSLACIHSQPPTRSPCLHSLYCVSTGATVIWQACLAMTLDLFSSPSRTMS